MAPFACMLRWGSVALTLTLASTAHAHGSSSSDSGSSGSGSSDSSGSTDSGSTDSGSSDSSTTEACGTCDMVPGDTMFTTPNNGSNVDSPIAVEVTVVPRIGCDCTEVAPIEVVLYLDEEPYGEPCLELTCSWQVETTVGGHRLYAGANFGPEDYLGETIMVFVQHGATETGADTSTSTTETGPSDETTTTTAGGNEDKGGCSCTTTSQNAAWLLAPLALLLLRRRRAR